MIAWPERHSFGLEDERLRERVLRAAMDADGVSAAAAAHRLLSGIHEAHQMIRTLRPDIGRMSAPPPIMHALEDDVASAPGAEFVALNVGSSQVRTIAHRNGYHIATMADDKRSLADASIGPFRGPAVAGSGRSAQSSKGAKPEHLSAA